MTTDDIEGFAHRVALAKAAPDLLEAAKAIDAAFPATLHRNGAQVKALAAIKAAIAQVTL